MTTLSLRELPERACPTKKWTPCLLWMFHSMPSVNAVASPPSALYQLARFDGCAAVGLESLNQGVDSLAVAGGDEHHRRHPAVACPLAEGESGFQITGCARRRGARGWEVRLQWLDAGSGEGIL